MRLNLKFSRSKWTSLLLLVLLTFSLSQTFAQDGKITGTVSDSQGVPIPGATIGVKGTGKGTATTPNGAFSIVAKEGDVLVVSSVSYATKEVTVTAAKNYKITLEEANKALKEVVVVGYGTSSRKTLSSSISTVKPEELNKGAIADVGQLLQGKVPGLNITSSGDPNKPAAVVLRGASTINGSSTPFYVIDGIPGADITSVAPADIASIDVLKDAAATAIYGNRASSGVIMITTKRGKKGQSQVAYNGYVGMEKVSSKLDLMNASQLRSYVTANNTAFSPNDDISAGNINTDWMAAIERSTGISHSHNISLSGGGEHSTYSASLNYFNKQGILAASSLERVIGRLNVDQYALNDKLKFSLSLSNMSSAANNEPLQNIVLLQAAKHMPISPIYNTDGSYFENLNTTGYFNPLAIVGNAQDQTKYNTTMAAFNTQLKLPFDLTYNVNLSYQKTSALHGEFYSSYFSKYPTSNFYNNPDPGIGISHTLIGSLFGSNGSALRSEYENTAKTLETFLTWDKSFGDHSITAVLGYSYQDNINGDGLTASSTNFPTDNLGFQNLSLGNPYAISGYRINLGNDQTYGEYLLISDFFRLNYSYKNKYLLQGSIRRDGSSVFGANNSWGNFPSVSVAWRISEEDFMKKQSLISDLKLRASYGQTGNSSGIGPYTGQLLYGTKGTYYNNGVQAGAYGPIQGQNPDLKWETTASTNIGLDFGLFGGKISGSVDWYNKNTSGMLFGIAASSSIVPGGWIYANGGSINNKGIEVVLNATPVSKGDISWSTSLNLAANQNTITSLQNAYGNSDNTLYSDPEGAGQTNATLQILKVGQPLGEFYSLRYAGKDASGNSLFYKGDGTGTTTAPAIRTDYFYLGSPQPKALVGWSNTINYKKFDLGFFFRGSFGGKIMDATRADLSNVSAATINNIVNSASGDKITDIKNSYYSDRYLEDGSYVRLDNATLGYTLKKPFTNVSSIRVYFTANNVFTLTGYKGIDPEINQGGVSPGIDYNNFYPKTRTLLLGLNVSF
ncbi:SusC/RagA family TonB-linked outer membrane protein [Mucilaginibacter sp. PPCGB 2223]|uniref:SusC/RagA family TonB-linked outer membrane protein n=1 Tax=Mucilaginibacter sp. PPCGB 2223 TaxID=1886027 RepID=UPI00082553F8|nr:TonB-dependent receptor [Mucilaginibacter sp. PPCGB 2223]OCX52279.1 SusC/RagA family TonB-linked outer membrane protein [Mucilaginibacter sp. PPCGB 2223]